MFFITQLQPDNFICNILWFINDAITSLKPLVVLYKLIIFPLLTLKHIISGLVNPSPLLWASGPTIDIFSHRCMKLTKNYSPIL